MGRKCPKCKKQTFNVVGLEGKCTNPECGFSMRVPPNKGKGGKGCKCPFCHEYTVFNGVCNNPNCGAFEVPAGKK